MMVYVITEQDGYRNDVTSVFSTREKAITNIINNYAHGDSEITIDYIEKYLAKYDTNTVRFGNLLVTIEEKEIQ